MANAAAVPRQVLGAITSQLTEVALDLITLTYIDSAGLRVLFTLGTRLETLQIALQLLVPTESPIRKMIESPMWTRLFPCGRPGIDGGGCYKERIRGGTRVLRTPTASRVMTIRCSAAFTCRGCAGRPALRGRLGRDVATPLTAELAGRLAALLWPSENAELGLLRCRRWSQSDRRDAGAAVLEALLRGTIS